MGKLLITESQFQTLGSKGLITEFNLDMIKDNMEKYMLPKYKEYISTQGKPNNKESIIEYLSQSGSDTNWRVGVLCELAQAED